MQPLAAQHLPDSLADVVEIIGIEATLSLVEKLGGTRVYIPDGMSPSHHLVRLVGHKAAYALANAMPGETVDLPRCVNAVRAARDAQIRAERDSSTVRNLALKYGLTERQIYSILADGEPQDSPQQSLL